MDVPLLRTLAWKSILGFGKYAELSVQQVFDLKHTNYLRWVYYNMSNISFNEEILRQIKVIHENHDNRIEKPGINPELHEEINHFFFNLACKSEKSATIVMNRIKKGAKMHSARTYLYDNKQFSKGNMQRKNHGH